MLTRRAAGETVLLNLNNEQYYSLEGVGSRLWQLMQESITFGGAVDALAEEYDVERKVLQDDLASVLADLSDRGLVRISAA